MPNGKKEREVGAGGWGAKVRGKTKDGRLTSNGIATGLEIEQIKMRNPHRTSTSEPENPRRLLLTINICTICGFQTVMRHRVLTLQPILLAGVHLLDVTERQSWRLTPNMPIKPTLLLAASFQDSAAAP